MVNNRSTFECEISKREKEDREKRKGGKQECGWWSLVAVTRERCEYNGTRVNATRGRKREKEKKVKSRKKKSVVG
jgi:hypothetical protein